MSLGGVWRAATAAALVAAGCESPPPPPPSAAPPPPPPAWFAEMAAAAGLDFVHESGHDGRRFLLPESAAGGGALFDVDGDGFLDVYLVQSAGESGNRLYRNLGDGSFEDVTAGSGAGDRGYGMGVTTGDFDGDGDLDLYLTNVGPNVLLRNDGPGGGGRPRFTDVTAEAGVGDPGFGSSAAFFDADGDGDLDLWVVNYVVWSPAVERRCRNKLGEPDYCDPTEYDAPAPDVLYRNDGAKTRSGVPVFRDVSAAAGLRSAFGNGLGIVVDDFHGDRRPEVFVANDRMPDQLWVSQAGAAGIRFADRGFLAGCAIDDEGKAKAGMGTAAEDFDGDGDPDLMVVNFHGESDSLFRNQGDHFVDVTAASGLAAASRPYTRFGLGFADFDNDATVDVFEAAGRVARRSPRHGADPYAEPNLLLRGSREDGRTSFAPVLPAGGTAAPLVAASRAAAFGDVDNDGGVDVLVVNRDGPVHLLWNVVTNRGHWLSLRVLDEHGGDALGAVVRLRHGDREARRSVRTAYSYCAASDPRVHVGLGSETVARQVRVEWVDGVRERFGDFAADQVVTLRRGRGRGPAE